MFLCLISCIYLKFPKTNLKINLSIKQFFFLFFLPPFLVRSCVSNHPVLQFCPVHFLAWCEELTHCKRPWCWERLRAGGEGDDGGWDGWMASLTQWTWVWVDSGGWWWTERPDMLWFMGLQRVGHHWETELNWITLQYCSGFVRTLTWISCGCTCVPHPDPPSISLPIPSLRVVLVHWLCVPYYMHWTWTGDRSISHIVTYMFQCYSPKSSQPRPLPQSPKVRSLYLSLLLSRI